MEVKTKLETDLEYRLNDIKDNLKRKIISDIIKKEDWYKKIDFDTAISILQDLGYNLEESKEIYILLNSNEK